MKPRRLILTLLVVFGIVVLLVAALAWYSYRRPLPQTKGALSLAELQDNVTIYRDAWGVPHIYAANQYDLFYAQGYIHAQDRWWQMEMNRHLGKGSLSSLLGDWENVQETDVFVRTVGWNRIAERNLNSMDAKTQAILRAYAAGVNAYLRERGASELAVEYTILGLTGQNFEVTPWEPLDSVAWSVALSWQMSGGLAEELRNVELLQTLSPTLINGYFPDGSPASSEISYPTLRPSLFENLDLDSLTYVSGASASHAWAASGENTASGAPLLAADTQLGFGIPTQWYEVGLHCLEIDEACPFDTVGMSLSGLPGIVSGHNGSIAWAFANTSADTQDIYVLRLNPQVPTRYQVDGVWHSLRSLEETIEISDSDPLHVTVYDSEFGVVISPPPRPGDRFALALRWGGEAEPDDFIGTLLAVNAASDWAGFQTALSNWRGSAQEVLYADVAGNIGVQTAGALPLRAENHAGDAFTPGWSRDAQWAGFTPYAELPSLYNPPEGYVVAGAESAYVQTSLGAVNEHNLDSFANLQADTYNPFAAALLPFLFVLDFSAEEDAPLDDYQTWLQDWDFRDNSDSPYPVLFSLFWVQLVEGVFDDQLKAASDGGEAERAAILALMDDPRHPWWDDTRTLEVTEDRDAALRSAFAAAIQDAEEDFGLTRENWRWGDLHTTIFRGIPLGNSGVAAIEELLNRGSVATGGGFASLYLTEWNTLRENRYETLRGPAYRMIIDLANFEASRSILATGQSGHAASNHYDDMIDLWSNVAYRDMLWEPGTIQAASEDILRLHPLEVVMDESEER
jgi:penicillin G amidase